MGKANMVSKLVLLSICLAVLTGCGKSAKERDEALAELEKAKIQLARTNAQLEQARNERDQMSERMADVLEGLEKIKSGLANDMQAQEILQEQNNELTIVMTSNLP